MSSGLFIHMSIHSLNMSTTSTDLTPVFNAVAIKVRINSISDLSVLLTILYYNFITVLEVFLYCTFI